MQEGKKGKEGKRYYLFVGTNHRKARGVGARVFELLVSEHKRGSYKSRINAS